MQEASEDNRTSHDVCARWMHPVRVYANNTIYSVGLDMYIYYQYVLKDTSFCCHSIAWHGKIPR
jgi:hypothetical protein